MREYYEKGELAKEILMLFVAGGLVATCVVLPGMAHVLKLVGATDARERQRVKQSLYRLRKQGIVVYRVKNGKEQLLVTPKGRERVVSYMIADLVISRPEKWDKRWRMVMFDIPERKKRVREEVSFKLRDMGMTTLQDSVFVSPFPCKKEVDLIVRHYGVHKHIAYIEADVIESERDLFAHFKLKQHV